MAKRMRFKFGRPQQLAALLLAILLAQCLWVGHRQTLTTEDYDFARCGREMWEKASPLTGYFTSCGNIADGTLGYRTAGLPLTVQRIFLRQGPETSTWEMRHELRYVLLLLHSGFVLAGLVLGGALWWVTRRLYGNTGGFIALSLYCFSPPVIRAATHPNNEILTALGFFAAIYTAVGMTHAMQGPRRRWRVRILLLAAALGFTAAAHAAAYLLAIPVALICMMYLAEGYREAVLPVLFLSAAGGLLGVFASYSFDLDAFSYYFRSGAGRMWLSLGPAERWFSSMDHAAVIIAAVVALLFYVAGRRSRYFGNTLPFLMAVLLFPLITTGVPSDPALWALPFLLAFIAGVFSDVLETPRRKLFLGVTASILLLNAALCLASLPSLI